jgi:predicted NAD/FAD-binding protein
LKVAVVGAGWAGLSAAVELAAQGIPVTIFEAAPNLGGRARGFYRNDIRLDNGQHILLGAYRETLRLMRQVGVEIEQALLRLPLRLETPGHLKLVAPHLPAPLHLLAGLLSAQGLDRSERWAALRFMTGLHLTGFRLSQDQTVAELLASQPEKLVRRAQHADSDRLGTGLSQCAAQ